VREVAGQRKKTQAKIDAQARAMTGGSKRGTGNGSGPTARLTDEWLSATKKDVKVKDEVTVNGIVITVIGRWTRKAKTGNVPMVTGLIVSGAPDGKKKGDRYNTVAAEATHVRK
jgi:hypothetical protein